MRNSFKTILRLILACRFYLKLVLFVRLSQDLAKDLAILAREIHDVAGDSESQSAPVESMAPAISAHEEVFCLL